MTQEPYNPNEAPAQLSEPGQILFGKYEVLEVLGVGGMGVVYKCTNQLLKKDVAVKTLSERCPESHKIRFQNEARVLGKFKHQNLVSIFDFGLSDSGEPYIVMEFVNGKSLATVIEASAPHLVLAEILEIAKECAVGLAYAHKFGVIHRDIKPSNIILIDNSEEPSSANRNQQPDKIRIKLVDFGISKLYGDSHMELSLTKTGRAFGSPPYMSPEQIQNKPLDARSDLYSLGCVMYEMISGRVPYLGNTGMDTMMMHISEQAPPLKKCRDGSEVPIRISSLVERLMQKDPDDRFKTSEALILELNDCLADTAGGASSLLSISIPEPRETFSAGASRIESIKLIGALVVVALLVGIAARSMIGMLAPDPKESPRLDNPGSTHLQSIDLNASEINRLIAKKRKHYLRENNFKPLSDYQKAQWTLDFRNGNLTESGLKAINTGDGLEFKRLRFYETTGLTAAAMEKLSHTERTEVYMEECDIADEGLKQLCKTPGLAEVIIKECPELSVDGFSELSKINFFVRLEFWGQKIDTATLRKILRRDNVEKLIIDQCVGLKPDWLEILSGLKRMHTLHIKGMDVEGYNFDMLRSMPNLTWINLSSNEGLTFERLKPLLTAPSLKELKVSNTDLPEPEIERLKKLAPPRLKVINPVERTDILE